MHKARLEARLPGHGLMQRRFSFIEENHAYRQASKQEQQRQQQNRRGQFSPELMTYWGERHPQQPAAVVRLIC